MFICKVKRALRVEKRCYIRNVEVYSPRPDFRAVLLFVTKQADQNGTSQFEFEYSIEPGLAWAPRPILIALPNRAKAALPMATCEQPQCRVSGDHADALADTLHANARPEVALMLSFRERDGALREIT